jgi:hypothetical protein
MMARASASTTSEDIIKFTFEYANHPTSITLHASYVAPANTNAALYDSGDGVWRSFTSRTIPIVASNKYVSFKGDWRKSGGTYAYMFKSTLNATNARCRTSGRLAYAPTSNASAYRDVFNGCTWITSFDDNPFQLLTGAPAADMFYESFRDMIGLTNLPNGFMDTSSMTGAPAAQMFFRTCYNMNSVKSLPAGFMNTSGLTGAPAANMFANTCLDMFGVTNLPAGFLDTSGLTGAPAVNMFSSACQGLSGVKTLPAGFMDTSGLTGAPAGSMFNGACAFMSGVTSLPTGFMDTRGLTGAPAASMLSGSCYDMSGVTNLPTGFMDISGLAGAPAASMLNGACQGMSGLLAGDFNMSSNITFANNNIASSMPYAFADMTKWTGTVYWGTNRIYNAITNPSAGAFVFQNSTNVPGYTTMGANWK